MTCELLAANKKTGDILDVSSATRSVEWTTNRTGSPGKLTFSLLKHKEMRLDPGDVVRFSVDSELQFYGWIFTVAEDRWGVIEVTCYDRLRYLKANASYAFYAQTAGDIIRQIAGDFQLDVGTIEDTGYKLPSLVEQDQTCLDIIGDALEQTLLNTGKVFVLYDDGNGLALQEAANMMVDVMIGDKSLLTDYTYSRDIDQQTYNSIKLARPNEETGRADVYILQDSETIGQWGLLQLYQTVDGEANEAQIQAQAQASLEYYNREYQTLKISSLGVSGLRAGQMLLIQAQDMGQDGGFSQYVLLDRVTHKWENNVHTMDIETMNL